MNKFLALIFAFVSIVWMVGTAISLDYNGWLALLFFVLTCATIALGFIVKAKSSRKVQKN
ncbi:hypothetical protein ACFPVX_16475 [Cohnella faecalis]|uniref:DUF5325 family protein n=1 Tax=Cohnella faecalis TaxID=2315694 RepID=A0A398CSH4_9BACL|nr:hypothetical protein [Cohnella faecalis]RIE02747.1 hypothetical protein D3H35_19070 [Cohnella faecalis]